MGEPRRTSYRLGLCPHGIYLDTRCFNCSPEPAAALSGDSRANGEPGPGGVYVTEERLAAALRRELHVDEEHGFPDGFGPEKLAAAVLRALREADPS